MTGLVLLGLLLWFVLPGLGGGVLLTSYAATPGRPGPLLARCLACGVSAWFLGAGLLARTVGLTEVSAWLLSTLLGLGGVVALTLPRSREVLRQAGREAAYAGAVALVSLVAWAPVGWETLRTTWSPLGSTPWYYWSLASQVATAGRVPDRSVEWGTTVPFLGDYELFTSGTAALLLQGRGADVQALDVVGVVAVLLVGAGASLLALSLGAGRVASLVAAPVTVGTGLAVVRLTAYRPEAFGLGLCLVVVALFVDALRHRERTSLVAGCVLGATLGQVHGIALVTSAMLLVAVVVALLPGQLAEDGRLPARAWPFLRRSATYAASLAASVVLAGVVLGGVSGSGYSGGLEDRGGSGDLTWEFYQATAGRASSEPATNADLLGTTFGTLYTPGATWVPLAVLAAVILLLVVSRRRPEAREVLLFAVVSVLAVAAVAAVFSLGWQGYVPRRTGQRGLKEMTLLAGPVIACALALALARVRRVAWRRVAPFAAVVVACAAVLPSSTASAQAVAQRHPSRGDIDALRALDLPAGSVVLTNGYVEGYLDQATAATGLLEGRAPYTFPDLLRRAVTLLRDAQEYFDDPRANRAFLDANGVDYVMVVQRGSYALATGNVFRTRVRGAALRRDPGLALVLDRPDFQVYRVVTP